MVFRIAVVLLGGVQAHFRKGREAEAERDRAGHRAEQYEASTLYEISPKIYSLEYHSMQPAKCSQVDHGWLI